MGRKWGRGGHALAEGTRARGREKRGFLNSVSGIMVISAGVAGAFFGYGIMGALGALIGGVLCAGFVTKFVVGGRYFR